MKLKVGQELWWVPKQALGNPCIVTVDKICRKFAKLSNGRAITIETMIVDGDGYASPGRCYLSEQDYKDEYSVIVAWGQLRILLKRQIGIPEGVTIVDIEQARKLLRL